MSVQATGSQYVFLQEGSNKCVAIIDHNIGCLDNACLYHDCLCWHTRKNGDTWESPSSRCGSCMSGHHDNCECKNKEDKLRIRMDELKVEIEQEAR